MKSVKRQNADFMKTIAEAERDIRLLEQKLEEAEKAAPEMNPAWESEKAELSEKLESEKANVLKMTYEISEYKAEIERMRDADAKHHRYIEDLESKLQTEQASAKEQLEAEGYHLEAVKGAGDPKYAFEVDGCKVYLDEKIHTFCIMKKVRRKYYKEVAALNGNDFSESYSFNEGMVICRKVYLNPVADLMKPIRRMKDLR